MPVIDDIIKQNIDTKIAIYGLGTETERFLEKYGNLINVVGLLDGFREDGEMYNHPIISFSDTIEKKVGLIIVVARPGSCKAIVKRIRQRCIDNNIMLYDVRGRNLLSVASISYEFDLNSGSSREELIKKISEYDVISFDLFDTLVMRKVCSYTDLFTLVEKRLETIGSPINDFSKLRLAAEKELSKEYSPTLENIYIKVLDDSSDTNITSTELANLEWEIDFALMLPRNTVCDILHEAHAMGKKVAVTTDSYYSENQIRQVLELAGIGDFDYIFVSSKEGVFKTQGLYNRIVDCLGVKKDRILHVGDDEFADVECATRFGISSFRLHSAYAMCDLLGGLGIEEEVETLYDRIKEGLFISKLFNDPFVFEEGKQRLSVRDSYEVGYLFCAPMISDFIFWLKAKLYEDNVLNILFCARDGYLIEKLFKKIDIAISYRYFYTSRTAAIRAGIECEDDIAYVDSMKFFGSDEESLRIRYGVVTSNSDLSRNELILNKSSELRENYKKYIDKMVADKGSIGLFDFVAKGTTQMYLQRLMSGHVKGYYFLQLEPEFMSDKGLDIEPFYSDEEKNTSAIFENYYILETLLTSPDPSVDEFDTDGNPVFAKETRSTTDIECFMRAQEGILSYFDELIRILPESECVCNKKLDEKLLTLINNVRILDSDFISLIVEDPFFGRMTAVADLIG